MVKCILIIVPLKAMDLLARRLHIANEFDNGRLHDGGLHLYRMDAKYCRCFILFVHKPM